MAVQVVIAIVGFYLIQYVREVHGAGRGGDRGRDERPRVDEGRRRRGATRPRTAPTSSTAITQLLTAIGIGWGITWLTWSSDYTRFIKPGTPDRRCSGRPRSAIFIPTVWLGFLGASIASARHERRPGRPRDRGVRRVARSRSCSSSCTGRSRRTSSTSTRRRSRRSRSTSRRRAGRSASSCRSSAPAR